jgi:hypothetical protein
LKKYEISEVSKNLWVNFEKFLKDP